MAQHETRQSIPRTFTVSEAATMLGISRTSAFKAVRSGELPSLRFGRRIVIPRAAIEHLLDGSEDLGGTPRTSDGAI